MLSSNDDKHTKHSSNPEDIFKSAKNFLEQINIKENITISETTISQVLSKIPSRKKILKQSISVQEINKLVGS